MCVGGGSSTATAPVAPDVAPEAPTMAETPTGGDTSSNDARRRAAATGRARAGTILTGSRGTQDSGATATKTLLGQ